MSHGRVKWLTMRRAMALHALEEDQTDIFIHYSAIQGEGYRALREGDAVTFELKMVRKALRQRTL